MIYSKAGTVDFSVVVSTSVRMSCPKDLTGQMSELGLEQRPPIFVQRLMHILRTVLLTLRDILRECAPIDQLDGMSEDDALLVGIEELLGLLDEEFTADAVGDTRQ